MSRRIVVNPTLDMETLEWVSSESYEYDGPVEEFCGPSSAETSAAQTQSSFAQMLYNNYSTYFGEQSDILNEIKNSMSPILAAGPNQTGFSAAENAALNTEATDTNAAAAAKASTAVNSELAGRGDNSGLESGVDQQIQAGIKSQAAGNLAAEQNEITQENYATGRQNYFQAAGALGNTAEQFNPASIGSEFNTGEENAFGMNEQIQQQNNALGQDLLGGALGLAGDVAGAYGSVNRGSGANGG